MFKSLISECLAYLSEAGEENQPVKAPRKHKHDRAAERTGHLLNTPLSSMSRRKMLKTIPHLHHHFEKGHGKGEGDYRTVDLDDLNTLSKHAEQISNDANAIMRMPGPAHHLAGHLCKHVASAHERMSKYWTDNSDNESAELHGSESAKYGDMAKHHHKVSKRHGYGY
jgi:hypothetical protein